MNIIESKADLRGPSKLLAKINPKAFPSSTEAFDELLNCWQAIRESPETTAIGTGGFMFYRSGDRCIELWISYTILKEYP